MNEVISIVINYANGKSQTFLSTTIAPVESLPPVVEVSVEPEQVIPESDVAV